MEFPEIAVAAGLMRAILDRGAVAPERLAADRGAASGPAAAPAQGEGTRAGRMDAILRGLCARPGVRGALVADADGLAVASHGGAVAPDRLAACSSLLGATLDGAGRVLEARTAERISLQVSAAETALMTRFEAEGLRFHLLVLCAPAAAERLDLSQPTAALRLALATPAPAQADG